ncbi:Hypothetical protein ADP8_05208 (plasmid) [Roseomonas mucosa]|nr:Hypothetical protein ADP8_05208 [Roseomonas mucosa]UZO94828.1 Hypothetical protein RMP42_05208 [Roseomonas mucosa]
MSGSREQTGNSGDGQLECSVEGGLADLQAHRRVAHGQALGDEVAGTAKLLGGDNGLTPTSPSPRLCSGEPGAGASGSWRGCRHQGLHGRAG